MLPPAVTVDVKRELGTVIEPVGLMTAVELARGPQPDTGPLVPRTGAVPEVAAEVQVMPEALTARAGIDFVETETAAEETETEAVSYTHLTLPTKRIV